MAKARRSTRKTLGGVSSGSPPGRKNTGRNRGGKGKTPKPGGNVMRCFVAVLAIMGWFVYGLGDRWVTAQESIAQAQVESCEVLSDFRSDVRAVTDAHSNTSKTFASWLNGNVGVDDVTEAIASQGDTVEALWQKVKK